MSNKKFMCLLRSASGSCEKQSKPSATDMEAMMATYQAWQSKFADNILDMGGALTSEGKVVDHDTVKDGPFMELKEVIGGYMLLTADSMETAVKIIEASPMVANPGTSIELREISTP